VEFAFSADQDLLRQSVREFAETEVGPVALEHDEKQEFPYDVVRKAAGLGYYGVIFPEEYGGAGLGYIEYVIVVEELSRMDGSVGISVAAHNSLCSNHIYECGNEDQRRTYLVPLASGKKIGAWSLTEPTAGSDAGGTRTTARAKGDGWVLNGSKTFTTHGSVGDVVVVFAVTDPDRGKHGISAFVVEKGTPGFRAGKKENKMGLRASDTSEVVMEDCYVPGSQLLGERGQGFVDAMKVLDGGRISIAALALGMARGAYDAALRYAKERQQFGKPIAEFQAVQFQLAQAATELEAARLMVYNAARLEDAHEPYTKEAAMAKLFASQVAERVTSLCVELFGGYGYTKEYPVEKFYRDAKIGTIYEGTSNMQLNTIAKMLLK
jgi:alkylation response protein AidB-like acyl-CoA dehydrogenase